MSKNKINMSKNVGDQNESQALKHGAYLFQGRLLFCNEVSGMYLGLFERVNKERNW